MDPSFTIRQMTLEELKLVIEWANSEGWYYLEGDAEAFYNADPSGFFIGLEDDVPVASFAAIKFQEYCFWTLFIVREQCRGKGYGSKIFAHARNYCKDAKVMALDAAGDLIDNYKRYGFKEVYQTMSFKKVARGALSSELVELKSVAFEELSAYDKNTFGYERQKFLETFIKKENYRCLGKIRDGKLVGYGMMREGKEEWLIGPVIADDKEAAEDLLSGLQSYVPGKTVFMEIFDVNEDAVEIAEQQGWENFMTFSRMHARGTPKTDMSKMYAAIDEIS